MRYVERAAPAGAPPLVAGLWELSSAGEDEPAEGALLPEPYVDVLLSLGAPVEVARDGDGTIVLPRVAVVGVPVTAWALACPVDTQLVAIRLHPASAGAFGPTAEVADGIRPDEDLAAATAGLDGADAVTALCEALWPRLRALDDIAGGPEARALEAMRISGASVGVAQLAALVGTTEDDLSDGMRAVYGLDPEALAAVVRAAGPGLVD
jgi:hypothetical protein